MLTHILGWEFDSAGVLAPTADLTDVNSAVLCVDVLEDLTGSTIMITSLGKLGAIMTTPIINRPEVAIVGVNRMAMKPLWNGASFVPRTVFNLSCSFDHRVVGGWAAATFVARLKELLETPALLVMDATPAGVHRGRTVTRAYIP